MNFKFKVGDRVRVTKIDDLDFYGVATYSVGDVGTIITGYDSGHGIAYCIDFDKIPCIVGYWAALEDWLQPEQLLIVCE